MTDSSEYHRPRRLGVTMIVLAWVVGLGLLTAYFSGWLSAQHNPNQRVAGITTVQGVREVKLKQNRQGHYVAFGMINGERVQFLLDTGATDVSVPQSLARRLALQAGAQQIVHTANGSITTYVTRLDQVRIGNIELFNIPAHINPRMQGDEVLLGMSFLRHLEMIQRAGHLTLRQVPDGS